MISMNCTAPVTASKAKQSSSHVVTGLLRFARNDDLKAAIPLPQPRECGGKALCLGGFLGVIGAGFFNGFGLGAFDERRIVEAGGEGVTILLDLSE